MEIVQCGICECDLLSPINFSIFMITSAHWNWPFVKGIYSLPIDFPHRGPVIRSLDVVFVGSLDTFRCNNLELLKQFLYTYYIRGVNAAYLRWHLW